MCSCRLPMGRDPLREEGPGWPSSSTTLCPSSLCFYPLAVGINSREKPNAHVPAAGHAREEAPGTGKEPGPGQASRAGSCCWAQPAPQQPLHLVLRAPRTGQVKKARQRLHTRLSPARIRGLNHTAWLWIRAQTRSERSFFFFFSSKFWCFLEIILIQRRTLTLAQPPRSTGRAASGKR